GVVGGEPGGCPGGSGTCSRRTVRGSFIGVLLLNAAQTWAHRFMQAACRRGHPSFQADRFAAWCLLADGSEHFAFFRWKPACSKTRSLSRPAANAAAGGSTACLRRFKTILSH